MSLDIAPTIATIPLTARDVDRRAAAGLLTDVAHSVDGVLWSASHPVIGPYLRIEDPAQRVALYHLTLSGAVVVIVPVDFSGVTAPPPALSACDILRDPVEFVMSVSDVATRVDATYQEQPVPPATEFTERHVTVIDAPDEIVYGTRAVSLQTDLTTAADTQRVAAQIIARLAARSLLTLLDGVTRGGQALLITDLDAWSPVGATAPVYLEGGSYRFDLGGWSLSLIVSRSFGVGRSVAWDELPNDAAWKWDAFDPSITWDSLRGVAGP